jgi:hypothetical protein
MNPQKETIKNEFAYKHHLAIENIALKESTMPTYIINVPHVYQKTPFL